MCAEFIQSIMLGIVKLLFLVALVILGIVLLPQGWVDEAKDAFAGARSYLSQTIKERSPESQRKYRFAGGRNKKGSANHLRGIQGGKVAADQGLAC